jgi:hypothetical protein
LDTIPEEEEEAVEVSSTPGSRRAAAMVSKPARTYVEKQLFALSLLVTPSLNVKI